MKAISLSNDTHEVGVIDIPQPVITRPDQLKVQVLEVGICGTDREQVTQGYGAMPEGDNTLVIGHEMFGKVVEVGSGITQFSVGDYAVLTVRRGCGECIPCHNNRSDLCYTGRYVERGIKASHGFETEYVVDEEQYAVKVPQELASVGVLTEPMSVAEKAIDEAGIIQAARLPNAGTDWLRGSRTLVAGLGPIGLLAAIALRLRGAQVIGLDIVDEKSRRPEILRRMGGTYLDGRIVNAMSIDERFGQIDFVFEATGVSSLGFELIDALGVNGIYVMTGIPHGDRPVCITGAELMKQIVLKNQIILGSVNASTHHFALAVQDLCLAKEKWGTLVDDLITTRIGYQHFIDAMNLRSEDDIKTVITWNA